MSKVTNAMGIFDFLKKTVQDQSSDSLNTGRKAVIGKDMPWADSSTIAPDERKYYQPDEYYTFVTHKGTPFERKVVTFEERKKCSFPTANGLYVGEVLLLEYCSYGKYPKPNSGYPGFWWFEYGIRDVGHVLESLEKRGFLQWCPLEQRLSVLKTDDLKQILACEGLPTSGKKADLIDRIITGIPGVDYQLPETSKKYSLTPLGQTELQDNGYIPYMHKHPYKTTEDAQFGEEFNVWSINKLLSSGDAKKWRTIVGGIELKQFGVNSAEADPKVASGGEITSAEMRKYLAEQKEFIARNIRTKGDGYTEEMMGIDLKRIGKDKEALVQFYIAIGKKFDAPALYREAVILLEKYELYDEALYVIDRGMKYVPATNRHHEVMIKQRDRIRKKANK